MPAGRVLGVLLIALVIAALFNSEAIVRAGEGMQEGTTRDIVLSVGRPLDDVAGTIGLHLPREGLDVAFGQEDKTASGTALESGSTRILQRRPKAGATADEGGKRYRQPQPGRPLEVLVTGDSEAQFVGERMTDQAPSGLLEIETVPRNSTALTNPGFFNWELNAQQEVDARDPDAVVMAIGGNDGFNVEAGGQLYGPGDPEWQTEFARRVAVVAQTLAGDNERPVYWMPPPTARKPEQNAIYATQNRAVKQAEAAVPGLRYVDVFSTLGGGRYSDDLKIDGRRVLARQSDGIHFSRDGAIAPARLVLEAMARDYPALAGGRTVREGAPQRDRSRLRRARRAARGCAVRPGRAARLRGPVAQPAGERRLAVGRHRALPAARAAALARDPVDLGQPPRLRGRRRDARLRRAAAAGDPREPRDQRRPAQPVLVSLGRPQRDGGGRAAPLRGLGQHRAPGGGRRELRGLQPRAGPGVEGSQEPARRQLGPDGAPQPRVLYSAEIQCLRLS